MFFNNLRKVCFLFSIANSKVVAQACVPDEIEQIKVSMDILRLR